MREAHSTRGAAYWVGWAMSGLVVAFLGIDAIMKLLALPIVIETSTELGWTGGAVEARLLGVILLAGTVLYVAPRSSVLGAIFLTGYLGGAIAAHVRVGSPLLTHVLFGAYVAAIMWGGLCLRDRRIRGFLRHN